ATESLVAHEYDRGLRGREVGRAEVGEDLVPVDGRNEKVGEAVAVQITGTVVPEPEGLLRFVRRLEHRHVELRPYGRLDRDDVARIARAIDGSNREVVVVLDEQVADVDAIGLAGIGGRAREGDGGSRVEAQPIDDGRVRDA